MNTAALDPHAPRSYKDLVGNGSIFEKWAATVANQKPTHVLWVGPVGIGKSTFWKLVAPAEYLLVINCYSDSGLREQRDSIKHFIRLSSGLQPQPEGSRGSNRVIRYILFEHAEVLSDDAQAFLRRMLEVYSSSIFCIFEVRDTTAISDPISSRCQTVQLSPLSQIEIEYEIQRRIPALPAEKIKGVSRFANGNLRWALLQAFGSAAGFSLNQLCLTPPLLKGKTLKEIVEWETALHDNGFDPRIGLLTILPPHTMELWRRIMETPGGVHTRSQTILLATDGLTAEMRA
jgi:replication-associated recombination protein RarA